MSEDHYTILGIAPSADFQQIKKAYYRRAKECHPDLFGGDRSKEEEFKRVVGAFNVLSDPLQRRAYDARFKAGGAPGGWDSGVAGENWRGPEDRDSILDTHADDALEELIVGNVLPRDATLATLMLDLEQTERFCLFREAKTCFYNQNFRRSAELFSTYVQQVPWNILAHYFLGQSLARLQKWSRAERELRAAIRIGESRSPPLRLSRIRREMRRLSDQHGTLFSRIRKALTPAPVIPTEDPDEQMRRQVSRSINQLAAKGEKKSRRKRLK